MKNNRITYICRYVCFTSHNQCSNFTAQWCIWTPTAIKYHGLYRRQRIKGLGRNKIDRKSFMYSTVIFIVVDIVVVNGGVNKKGYGEYFQVQNAWHFAQRFSHFWQRTLHWFLFIVWKKKKSCSQILPIAVNINLFWSKPQILCIVSWLFVWFLLRCLAFKLNKSKH